MCLKRQRGLLFAVLFSCMTGSVWAQQNPVLIYGNFHATLFTVCACSYNQDMSLDALQEARAWPQKQPTVAGKAGLGSSLAI